MREKQKALRSKAHQPYDLSEIQRNGFGSKEGDSPVTNLKGSGQSIAKLKEDFYQEALAELSSSTLLKEQKFYACLSSKSKKSNTEQVSIFFFFLSLSFPFPFLFLSFPFCY